MPQTGGTPMTLASGLNSPGDLTNDGTYLPTDSTGYSTPASYQGYTLTWSDEFNTGSQLDQTKWNFEQGGTGWGNQELENYTNRIQNCFLSQGNLIIEARI